MANEVTITTVDVLIPEIWTPKAYKATEANLVAANAVARFDQDVVSMGDVVHIPLIANLVANDKTAGTDVTYQANTETKFDVTINKHKEATTFIEENAAAKVAYDLMELYSEKTGYAIAKRIDTDVLALTTSFSQIVGTLGVQLTDTNILRAIQYLDDADAPFSDRRFIFAPVTIAGFRQQEKFTNVAWTGTPTASPMKGMIESLYSVPVSQSTNVPTSGGNSQNSLIHKEAIGLAIQKQPKLLIWFNGKSLGTQVTTSTMYGTAALRSTFGVLLNGL